MYWQIEIFPFIYVMHCNRICLKLSKLFFFYVSRLALEEKLFKLRDDKAIILDFPDWGKWFVCPNDRSQSLYPNVSWTAEGHETVYYSSVFINLVVSRQVQINLNPWNFCILGVKWGSRRLAVSRKGIIRSDKKKRIKEY